MVRRLAKVGLPKDFQADSLGTYSFEAFKNLPGIEGHVQTRKDVGKEEITGWFLGTKAENMHIFCELITEAMNNIAYGRRSFHPEDPGYVTEEIKKTPGYLAAIQSLKDNFYRLITFLNDYSVPWFSMRYQGHMNWDVTLPSLVGYFTAMLQNQNNVSIQGSPATTFLEIFAANDMCTMIGFDHTSWGHITCDGTVANIEALWSARELRYLPIGIKDALNNEYKDAKDHVKVMFGGEEVKLVDLDEWQLLNLSNNEILEIPLTIAAYLIENANNDEEKIKEKESEIWDCLTKKYSVNALGMVGFYEKYHLKERGIKQPAVIVPSSKHYSWPKAASLLGLGHGREEVDSREEKDILEDGLINVFVDEKARMDTGALRDKLNTCRENRKPVILTVAVIGSTEESAVDPLKDIITMRNDFREPEDKTPFDFTIHADAAWGGYLVSIIRKDFDIQKPGMWEKDSTEDDIFIQDTSKVPLSTYVIDQMKELRNCDSVTVDPHKWGYVPYPAGSLCYRNGKMINLVTFGAPYIGSESGRMMSIGESGVEGSKPGASAAAVFLSHCVIRPSVKGYGKLMGQSLLNARLFYIYVLTMVREGDPFFVVPFNELPDAIDVDYLRKLFYEIPVDEIFENEEAMHCLKEIGSDQNFVDYIFNFYDLNGKPNKDIGNVIKLHDLLFEKVYPQPKTKIYDYGVMISKTTFHRADYGPQFMNALAERLGVSDAENAEAIPCMRSVVLDPWACEIKVGEERYNFFQEVFIPELRKAVIACVEEVRNTKEKEEKPRDK